jgi:hypothetical protein
MEQFRIKLSKLTKEDEELGALPGLTSRERRVVAEGSRPSNAGLSGLSWRVRTRVRESVSFQDHLRS